MTHNTPCLSVTSKITLSIPEQCAARIMESKGCFGSCLHAWTRPPTIWQMISNIMISIICIYIHNYIYTFLITHTYMYIYIITYTYIYIICLCVYSRTSHLFCFFQWQIWQIQDFSDSAGALWGQYDEEFTTTANVVTAVWLSGEWTLSNFAKLSCQQSWCNRLTHCLGWDLGTGCMRWFRTDLSWHNSQAEGARGDNALNR